MSASPTREGALLGRLVLLGSAYAPAAVIVGFRVLPHPIGIAAIGLGMVGLGAWTAFLLWLPKAQSRDAIPTAVTPIDGEVTAYIASYLLPIIAASSPDAGDIAAYAICAALFLVVAFVAGLGSVNPVVYLFGLRVARAEIEGKHVIVLAKELPQVGARITIARGVGVVLVLSPER